MCCSHQSGPDQLQGDEHSTWPWIDLSGAALAHTAVLVQQQRHTHPLHRQRLGHHALHHSAMLALRVMCVSPLNITCEYCEY